MADFDTQRALQKNRIRRRGIYLLPNLFTTAALFAGFYAIVQAMNLRFDEAAKAIFAAMVLDGLDGRVARLTHTQSAFGAEYDSLADMVSFGAAPALIVYEWTLKGMGKLGWIAAFVYVAGAALRLARFNVMLDDPTSPPWRKNFFVGMPAPAGAVVGLLPVYLRFLGSGAPTASPFLTGLEIVYVVAIALLMASRVPHFSGKSIGRVPREYVAVVLIGVAAALLMIVNYPLEALVAVALGYLATIPFSIRQFKRLRRENG
jgi:CDP-diacylglycerol--serine O-phosphatidyltransferase